jgi:hypothetical protein
MEVVWTTMLPNLFTEIQFKHSNGDVCITSFPLAVHNSEENGRLNLKPSATYEI